MHQDGTPPCNRICLKGLHLVAVKDGAMPAPAQLPPRMSFRGFEVNLTSGELHKDGLKLALPPMAFGVLKALIERPGEVVTREELRARLWAAESFGEFDDSLNHAVNKLRRALGDSAEHPQFIETLPRFGYRFVAAVKMESEPAPAAEVATPAGAPAAEGAARAGAPWKQMAVAAAVLLGTLALLISANIAGMRNLLLRYTVPVPRIESIAVIPLANLSGDPQQEYLADGITDALITDLGQIRALLVVSRQSVVRYKGSNKPLREIARELGVDGVIEGTVQRSGDRVRITVQLIRAATDTHVWAESYDREFRDVLTLQSEVARAVAREIKVTLSPEESARFAHTFPVNPEAFEAYLKGQFHWYRLSPKHLDRALGYFQLALEKDPNYAPAYAGIANVWLVRGDSGFMPPMEGFPKARAAALKALELDETLAEGHIALGNIAALYDRNWAAGEREFRRGIELNPNSADGHFMYADYLISMQRSKEWAPEMRRVLALDPLNPFFQCFYGWHLVYLKRYDEAITQMRKAVAAEPGFSSAHMGLWGAFYKKGMYEEALAEADLFYAALNDHDVEDALRRGQAEGGYRRAMHNGAEVLARRARQSYVPGVRIARLYAHAGEKDQAIGWLQKANEQREPVLIHHNVAWDWDALRGDSRFQDLLRRVGLTP